jgi:secreted PhoX family phosphatase
VARRAQDSRFDAMPDTFHRHERMDPGDASFWDRMVERRLSRRTLIKATAAALFGASAAPLVGRRAFALAPSVAARLSLLRMDRFTPIKPSHDDDVILPPEFAYRTLIRWGDPISDRGDRFGFNCDFSAFLPFSRSTSGRAPASNRLQPDHRSFLRSGRMGEGLYVVNHEYPDPRFIPEIKDQQYAVGLSIVHLRRDRSGKWEPKLSSPYGRRYTATSPALLTGPAAGLAEAGRVVGTMGNCSGAITPWGTVLSCEEETRWFAIEEDGFGWGRPYDRFEHYSWVVEIDPFDPQWVPLKRTGLGRFHHENVGMRLARDARLVAYMGDDMRNGFVYKYVSNERYRAARGLANGSLLDRGQLFVAHCREDGTGSWTPLPMNEECLGDTHSYILEKNLAATPMDRPEDLEIHPRDGSVYIALTSNTQPLPGRVIPPLAQDPYGKIARFLEKGADAAAATFSWEVFAVGGPEAGFAAPDNLEFDRFGNLWIISDFAPEKPEYGPFGNNGMFMAPTSGEHAGVAFQFASAPNDAEFTGPWLSPDETSLFLSVQHPGAGSVSAEAPTSRWPGDSDVPRPSTIVIQRQRSA